MLVSACGSGDPPPPPDSGVGLDDAGPTDAGGGADAGDGGLDGGALSVSWPAGAELRALAVDEDSAELSWSAAAHASAYVLFIDGSEALRTARDDRRASLTPLRPGTTYIARVEAVGEDQVLTQNGPSTSFTTASSPDEEPPTWRPGSVLLAEPRAEGISISWTEAIDNVAVTGYRISVDGNPVAVVGAVSSTTLPRAFGLGSHAVEIVAVDARGNESVANPTASLVIRAPTPPTFSQPSLTVIDVGPDSVALAWSKAVDDVAVGSYIVQVNGVDALTVGPLASGARIRGLSPATSYVFGVLARDNEGTRSEEGPTATATTSNPPSWPAGTTLTGVPTTTSVTLTWGGLPSGATELFVLRDGVVIATLSPTSTTHRVEGLLPGETYGFALQARDGAGVRSRNGPVARVSTLPLAPPDPAAVAPAPDLSVPMDFKRGFRFLIEGDNPVQTGVQPGALNDALIAVVRGRVLDRSGAPVGGLTVKVKERPDWGRTFTRPDGRFELLVNAEVDLTLDVHGGGFMPVQRSVRARRHGFVALDDITAVALDPVVTSITPGASGPQIARGSTQSDTDGARTATLLFPAGTDATAVLADGSTVSLEQLHVRATEYTVGSSGPSAMPGTLPPFSAYTYAVELSVDEALVRNATTVRFNQPVPFYLENFLGFSVGGAVPVGSYDRALGRWVAADDGVVLAIIDVVGGKARLDTDGDGQPDSADKLLTLGIDDAERQRLATLYLPGATLWRVGVKHFTPWDCNWPWAFPPDANPPPDAPPRDEDSEDEDECEGRGSIIGCESRSLRERIPVEGTPFSLWYSSDRTEAVTRDTLTIRVTDATVSPSLVEARVKIVDAGRVTVQRFPPTANQVFKYTSPRTDAFGRRINGTSIVEVTVEHYYRPHYYGADSLGFERSFGRVAGEGFQFNPARPVAINRLPAPDGDVRSAAATLAVARTSRVELGRFARDTSSTLGGWTLDVHQLYDRENKILMRGDGTRQTTPLYPAVGEVIAGGIQKATEMAIGPDGAFYFVEANLGRVRRIDPVTRAVTTVAGNGGGVAGHYAPWEPAHDALPGFLVPIGIPEDIAMGPDGLLYITTGTSSYIGFSSQAMIRRLLPDGRLERVVGNGCLRSGTRPPGVPACEHSMEASPRAVESGRGPLDFGMENLVDIALDRDGSIYFNTGAGARGPGLTRIHEGALSFPVGRVKTVPPRFIPEFDRSVSVPLPARGTALPFNVYVLFAARNGEVLFKEGSHDLLLLRGDGMVESVWQGGSAPNGCVYDADWMPDGTIVALLGRPEFGCSNADRVVRIGSGGAIETIASLRSLDIPQRLLVGPDGSIYVSYVFTIERVSVGRSSLNADFVPSPDGSEVSFFDERGRILQTRDALTDALRWEFFHDVEGRLVRLKDAAGRQTVIEYSGGVPVAIVAPEGLRTALRIENGGLTQVTHPDGRKTTLGYDGPLLTSLQRPGRGLHKYTYDEKGRLVRDEGPEGNFTRLAYRRTDAGFVVDKTTPEGVTVITVNRTDAGEQRIVTGPTGERTETLTALNGTVTTKYPDGSVTRVVPGADPRFGTRAPFPAEFTLTTPGGLSRTVSTAVTATFTAPGDPLALATLSTRVTVGSNTMTWDYSRSNRTLTRRSAAGRTETVRFDTLGHVSHVSTMPGGALADLGYDAQGRLVSHVVSGGALRRRSEGSWDARGRAASFTEEGLRTSTLGYSGDSIFPSRLTLADGNGADMLHDGEGSLTAMKPEGAGTWTHTRDGEGRLLTLQPPFVSRDEKVSYSWTPSGLRAGISWTDGSALTSTYSQGRLLSVKSTSGETTFHYAPASGQLVRMQSPSVSLQIERDGPLVLSRTWAGAVKGRIRYTYDERLLPASITVDGGASYSLTRDPDALLTSVGDMSIVRERLTGLMSSLSLGVVSSAHEFNAVQELTSSVHKVGTATQFAEELGYDGAGRVTSQRITDAAGQRTWTFTYDAAGRLTSTSLDGVIQERWSHDGNGDRVDIVKAGVPVSVSHDAQDRLVTYGGASFTWDVRGRLATKTEAGGTTLLDYDEAGALRSVTLPDGTSRSYAYDAEGRRVARFVNGVFERGYLWDGALRLAAEVDGEGAVLATYLYAEGINAPEAVVRGGETFRIISDHLGTPRLVLRASDGVVVQRLDWDPFGRLLMDTSPGALPFGFAGGLYDAATGLVRLGARDYDPATGRFLARDPLGFQGGQLNLYQYAFGDPVNRIDPTGLVSGRCLALDYLKKYGKEAWSKSRTDRNAGERGGNFSEELRNAEHYLYAYEQTAENSYNWGVMHLLTVGYSAVKATLNGGGHVLDAMGLGNPSPFRGTPATWNELLDGFSGANDALFGVEGECECK